MYCIILPFNIFVDLQFIMREDIEEIYKHSQSQLSNLSIKVPVSSSSENKTSSAIQLTTKFVPSINDKHQNNYVLCSQNTIHIDATITNNDDIESFETHFVLNISNISTPNHHSQCIDSISSITLTYNTPIILPPVGK